MPDLRNFDMKKTLIVACVFTFLFCWNTTAMAVPKPKPLDRDCTAAKAGKNMAMKATVGVGGPCGPADAAKDTAKGAVGLEDKKKKKKGLLKK
jgi:hypothetical protein